jgi:acid phosphatase family membrane protein YuiD
MRSGQVLALCLLLMGQSLQLYGATSKVVKLTAANFRDQVLNSKGVWMVEFYGSPSSSSALVRSLQELGS